MEYSKRLHRFMKIGILVVSMVLLLSAIPFTETTEADSFEVYGWVTDQSDNDAIEDAVYEKIKSYKRKIIPGTDDYEILFEKLYREELTKRGLA